MLFIYIFFNFKLIIKKTTKNIFKKEKKGKHINRSLKERKIKNFFVEIKKKRKSKRIIKSGLVYSFLSFAFFY